MDGSAKPRNSVRWRLAVWGLRSLGPGLVVLAAGLLAFMWSTPAAIVILAGGFGVYFAGIMFSFLEVHWAYGDVRPLRPNFARAHRNLFHDALHSRS